MDTIKLTDLINVEALQQLQDGFSQYTGMAALTTDSDGVPVTKGSGFTKFCMELTRNSEKGCHNCEACDRNGALMTLNNGHATVYDCHAGLVDFAAPIIVEGMVLGSVIGGQVRTEPVDEEKMRAKAIEYGIDPEEYIEAAKVTEWMPKERVEKAAVYLEEIAASISRMAYQSYVALEKSMRMEQAAKSQADFVMNMSMNLQDSMESWFRIVENMRQKSEDRTVREMLSAMQNNGAEMRSNIRDAIDYICMSESKVEIYENDYWVTEFAWQLKESMERFAEGKAVKTNLMLADNITEHVFGDIGRIGQMLTKTVKNIIDRKQDGAVQVEVGTHKESYATVLDVTMTDERTTYQKAEIATIRKHFDGGRPIYLEEEERDMWLALEGEMLREMGGTVQFQKDEDVMVIEVHIPQLSVE